jgi:adenosylcobinamide kinase/adenosylcobinamide-phosphate guanylyltransferase
MQQLQPASVALILGGVRSGKSRYAQRVAEQAQRVLFVATAERRDDPEMRVRIERHRADRPGSWSTVEEPLHLPRIIREAGSRCDLLLIDCLTLYAANLLEAYGESSGSGEAPISAQIRSRIDSQVNELCLALRDASCSVILVSNEVGSGVVPAYELGRRFRDLLGEINQRVAAVAGTVLLMVAGLPLPLKGSIPAEVRS